MYALPGIVWSSVGDDESQAGASGLARVNSSLPMTATTKVQVGSVTKTLLALGVLQLITDDRLALDTTAETLLRQVPTTAFAYALHRWLSTHTPTWDMPCWE